MEGYLTLVIAVGGVATGVGAIWTALVARRQLAEQGELLRDQGALANRQTLATEAALVEQRRSFEAQNERARITLESELMFRLSERWRNPFYERCRSDSVLYYKKHFLTDGKVTLATHLDQATSTIFEYFDEVGYLTGKGVLSAERVVSAPGWELRYGWALWEAGIRRKREEWHDPGLYANAEYLYRKGLDFDRERGVFDGPPGLDELAHWMQEALDDMAESG
jgi:hypothetical protein